MRDVSEGCVQASVCCAWACMLSYVIEWYMCVHVSACYICVVIMRDVSEWYV